MRRIVWYVASLEQKGGGERFALEAAWALGQCGHQVTVVCDRFDADQCYLDLLAQVKVAPLHAGGVFHSSYLRRTWDKVTALRQLFSVLRAHAPEIVFCQSEYDAIRVALLSVLLKFRFRVFIFGQMFQFADDNSRYARVFRRHLEVIRASRPGYTQTVAMPPPKLGRLTALVNEVVSRLKFWAIRRAERIFTLSAQVQWEVSLLYGRRAQVLRAAYRRSFVDEVRFRRPPGIAPARRFLSVCRLVEKKRVDLIIRAFALSGCAGTLRIVGSGSQADALRDLAQGLQLAARVVFLGSISDELLAEELESADCFISMDIGDFDIAVLEAMAKAVPVIVPSDFDVSSFPAGVSGVTVAEPQPEQVAQALRNASISSAAPAITNVSILQEMSWESLARRCMN